MIASPLPSTRVDDRLVELGWESVREYQDFHGLKPDNDPGPVTRRSMASVRFCPGPERMTGSQVCRWGKRDLKWHWSGRLPGLTDDEAKEGFRRATKMWEAVCDLRFQYVSQPNAADILLEAGAIDTAGGTLAWQELPCGSDRQRKGRYDTRDTWTIGTATRGRIVLEITAGHELGHAIGIPHISAGNMLQPTYDTRIRKPQAGDIREAQKRYGPQKAVPDPGEPSQPEPSDGITIFDFARLSSPAREGDWLSIGPIDGGG